MKPINIKVKKGDKLVTINWEDGHESNYPFQLLRAGCPCATCRGGHENMSAEPDPKIFEIQLPDSNSTKLANLELVGSYAITIAWEDGHTFGIFTWQYLRAMCPCSECRSGTGYYKIK
ncbi:MAG: hypothetical protein BGO78_01155 [Chloroflexi bacterium 44-23]|nr:MAG: hypothetical protein BGO78_01155 [Chloroflexi bacterium 44-23]